jgi:flagellar hook-associated protein FlgK
LDAISLGLVSAANTASRTADFIGSDSSLTIFGFQVNSDKFPNSWSGDVTYDINAAAYVPEQFGDAGINTEANMSALYKFLENPSNSLSLSGYKAANFISMAPTDVSEYFDAWGDPYITSEAANIAQQQSSIFINSSASLVSDVGVQVATWRSTQKADVAVMRNLKDQKDSLSGVNLDEEAANLLKYQQLYAASTKILQAGNQMFDTLLSIIN